MDFDVSLRKMTVKIRHSLFQRMYCFFNRHRLRNHPEAKLVILEARFEIRHQRVEQILFCLVEVTEVGSPAHVPDDADACRPQRVCH